MYPTSMNKILSSSFIWIKRNSRLSEHVLIKKLMKKNHSAQYHFFLMMLMLFFISLSTFSQDRNKLEKERERLKKEIEFTEKLLSETSENKQLSLSQLETLKQQIQLREKMMNNINKELNVISDQLDETTAIITALENDLQELKTEYSGMLYNLYKNRSSINQLIFIFNAGSFNDAFNRLKYLQQFSQFRKRQAELIEETKQSLQRKKGEQQERRTEKQKLLDAEQAERAKLNKEIQEKDRLVSSLQQQERKLREDIESKKRAAENLNKKIEEIIKKEIEKAKKEAELLAIKKAKEAEKTGVKVETKTNVLNLTPEAAKLSADFSGNQGKLPWPVDKGHITQGFGKAKHPVLKYVEVNNNGIDIRTTENSQVRSLFQGTVVTVMYNPGFQRAVMIRHGEYFTVYSNLKDVFVRSGDEVNTKQPIGLVHTDEKDGESKVHLEIWKGTQLLNPALWLFPNNP